MIQAGAAAILTVAVGAAEAVHAATGPTAVTLSIDPCVDVDGQEVQRLTDLQPHVPAAEAAPRADAVQVTITCQGGDGDVTMSAWDPASGQRARRTVPLTATARVTRPRLLAVSAVELAATVLAEAQARPPSQPSPPEAVIVAGKAETEPAEQKVSSWRLVAFGGGEWFPKLGDLTGGGLRLGVDGDGIGGVSIDALATFGSVIRPAGPVTVMSFSLSPLGGVHKNLGRYTVRAATGPRLAIGRLHGEVAASMAKTTLAPWIGWQLQLGMSAAIARHLVVELTAVGGYVVLTLGGRIMEERQVAIEGAWLGAFLSFGARADVAD